MKLSEKNCPEFIDVLASKEPVPGGGGAAALCAAIGIALGNMVGSLTVGKKKYVEVEEEILSMKQSCDRLQQECLELIDEDAKCFAPLASSYALPADTPEQQEYKSEVLEACSKEAARVPLEIMKKCCQGIELAERFAAIGSRLAVSDAGCAAAILKGALEAASLNIFINTKGLQDREYAQALNQEADRMLQEYGEMANNIFCKVKTNLS